MASYKLFYDSVHAIHFKSDVARRYDSLAAATRFYNSFQDLEVDTNQFFLVDVYQELTAKEEQMYNEGKRLLEDAESGVGGTPVEMAKYLIKNGIPDVPEDGDMLVEEVRKIVSALDELSEEMCYFLDEHILDGTVVGNDLKPYRSFHGVYMAQRAYYLNIAGFYAEWRTILKTPEFYETPMDIYPEVITDRKQLISFLRSGTYTPTVEDQDRSLTGDTKYRARAFSTLFIKSTSVQYSTVDSGVEYDLDLQLCLVTGRYTTRNKIREGFFSNEYEKISSYEVINTTGVRNLIYWMINANAASPATSIPESIESGQEEILIDELIARRGEWITNRVAIADNEELMRSLQQKLAQGLISSSDREYQETLSEYKINTALLRKSFTVDTTLGDVPRDLWKQFYQQLQTMLDTEIQDYKAKAKEWEDASYALLQSKPAP